MLSGSVELMQDILWEVDNRKSNGYIDHELDMIPMFSVAVS